MVGDRGYVESIDVNREFQPNHYREIFNLAFPVGLEAVFQASFSLIDQIVVGSLGATAVAAVGLSNNLSFILTLLYAAIGTGSGAFVAQAFGRRDMGEVSKIAAPAAVASVGQALGADAKCDARKQARRVLYVAIVAGLLFTVALSCVSFLLPILYPRVNKPVLNLAFLGIIIVAAVQPAKVINNVLGIGILPSGGDTKFVLCSHIVSSYAVCLPLAASMTLLLRCGPLSAFGSRALEELLKSGILLARYQTRAWQKELHT